MIHVVFFNWLYCTDCTTYYCMLLFCVCFLSPLFILLLPLNFWYTIEREDLRFLIFAFFSVVVCLGTCLIRDVIFDFVYF